MKPLPPFSWPRFLLCFIAAPFVVTLLTFWAFIPIYALFFGGPFYLLAGLPIAAWYLQRDDAQRMPLILIALLASLLQVPFYLVLALSSDNWNLLDALPVFLVFGAVFALLWTGTFILLYGLLGSAEPRQKETPDVHP